VSLGEIRHRLTALLTVFLPYGTSLYTATLAGNCLNLPESERQRFAVTAFAYLLIGALFTLLLMQTRSLSAILLYYAANVLFYGYLKWTYGCMEIES
jgi:hypothetical protein